MLLVTFSLLELLALASLAASIDTGEVGTMAGDAISASVRAPILIRAAQIKTYAC